MTQTGVPVALSALKDWSTWLVTIQTAVLAAVGYSLGKGALLPIDRNPLVRKLLVATFITLALSIFFATWALGAIPSILLRIQENPQNTDFYHMPISGAPFFESIYGALPGFLQSCLQLWTFVLAEHLLFLIGLSCFVLAVLCAASGRGEQRVEAPLSGGKDA